MSIYVTDLKIGGYEFKELTHYGAKHLGVDYAARFIPIKLPFDLYRVTYTNGPEGGLTVTGEDKLGYIYRFLHLDKFLTKSSTIPAHTDFAITGKSGDLGSSSGHLHFDIRIPNTRNLKLNIVNFIDPEKEWKQNILPNLISMIPQWFKDNGTDKWAKDKFIRVDQSDLTIEDCKELESLKKATMPATIPVNIVFHKKAGTRQENDALELAVRDSVRFYDKYVDLHFKTSPEANMSVLRRINTKLLGFQAPKGLSVLIVDDETLKSVGEDQNLNGLCFVNQRIILVDRDTLSRADKKNRGHVNGFACTLQHELSHYFGEKLDLETGTDRTHDFDYNLTLANYLPRLAWGLLHDASFRKNNNI